MAEPVQNTTHQDISSTLIDIATVLANEVHADHPPRHGVTLDSALDNDLGLDSLSRMEFFNRVESRFNIALSEQSLREIDTLRDMLRQLENSPIPLQAPLDTEQRPLDDVSQNPSRAGTVLDVLDWHVQTHPDRTSIRLLEEPERETTIDYMTLHTQASRVAAALQADGLQVGETVALMLPTCTDYFYCFLGILLAGAVPVPLYPPVRLSQLQDHMRRQEAILASSQARLMICMPEAKSIAMLLRSRLATLDKIVTAADLMAQQAFYHRPVIGADHTAFLQYTSGSTGNPKGVVLSHANLLANIRAMGQTVKVNAQDVFISWLPLYHDMGLIGAWLGIQYHSALLVIMSPLAFLSKPQRWLWAIHRYRGTLSAAPNFAYEFCFSRIADKDIEGLDLSSLRLAFNGAEPISATSIERFTRRFKPYGFRPQSMMPVYGLAENSLAVTFSDPTRTPYVDRVQRQAFTQYGHAVPCEDNGSQCLQFVSCGKPIPMHQVRIADDGGLELPDRQQGHVQFKGPSATSGYFRNAKASAELFYGQWLDSGDLGYIAEGDIFITGRKKDIIIRAGRNIYPQELEEAIGELNGIRKGCVAVFASAGDQQEQLIVIAETKQRQAETLRALHDTVHRCVLDLTQTAPDKIILAKPQTVLKTSSGKIRRSACRQLYEQGHLHRQSKPWIQYSQLLLSAIGPVLRQWWRKLKRLLFHVHVCISTALLLPPAWLGIMLANPRRRWPWVRSLLGMLSRVTGIAITVSGTKTTQRNVIYVANHASYIDALVMGYALRQPVHFIAKAELRQNRLLHAALQRMQVQYVERYDIHKSVQDAGRLRDGLQAGESVMIFPEGTFTRAPGVMAFHLGAFLTAVETATPIVPVSLRGTRNILRADKFFFHHGRIHVHYWPAIDPEYFLNRTGNAFQAALQLRDETRTQILKKCGEPDLAYEKNPAP